MKIRDDAQPIMTPLLFRHKASILLVDDEEDILSILNKYLSDESYRVYTVRDARLAAAEAAKLVPDVILLDVKMPGKDGYQVKAELNENPRTANIPVIFVSSSVTTLDKIMGLRLQADDYVTKPFDIRELLARIDTALTRRKHYEAISMEDELTGLPNARFFKKELENAFTMAKRYGHVFTVGFIDIDRFKSINDKFGHLTGNDVLREAAKRMESALRKPDLLTRYGGDEFCMIVREADHDRAAVALDRLKKRVEGNLYEGHENKETFPVSISVGMVTCDDKITSLDELMELADKSMYRSKKENTGSRPHPVGKRPARKARKARAGRPRRSV